MKCMQWVEEKLKGNHLSSFITFLDHHSYQFILNDNKVRILSHDKAFKIPKRNDFSLNALYCGVKKPHAQNRNFSKLLSFQAPTNFNLI